ncbi:Formamidopyrimidine-DNA glycosylase [Cladobotryum mycophilum]|uniref:Formamidopyrimidine-DNA glycosylase n=1 Tax=Cladobotryum mycophilum TaxID=491253 RepID=A0ABR0SSM3_9HYPO
MPEIAEVARIVHFLRQRLVGKTISTAAAIDDGVVFGKVGTTGKAVETALKGNKVISVGSQGKYFWITLEKPPHLVMHLGMTGWVHIKGEKTAYTNYYKKQKNGDVEEWPPKFWKFHVATTDDPSVEVAFVDSRRFGRVRLVDCPGDKIRSHSPLVENGPDPVVDKDRFTEEYLAGKMKKRHVPIKALLLDQAMISGIGNWVADETLYQAKLHPEQYSDTFTGAQITTLHEMIRYVCQTAVDKLGDSDEFPNHWLFNHRWGKGGKGAASVLPNGEKLAFITVGGRTSCYAPGVQKKTGAVAPGAKAEPVKSEPEEDEGIKQVPKKSRKKLVAIKPDPEGSDEEGPSTKKRRTKQTKSVKEEETPAAKVSDETNEVDGRRRSSRLRK